MKAMALAAGLGTRLMPLTKTTPKCLMPVAGKPLLGYWFDVLEGVGVKNCLINTHYLANKVHDYVHGSRYGSCCALVHEHRLLGTAGTLIANIDYFRGDDALIFHADNFCTANFDLFINAFRQRPGSCLMSMMTFVSEDPESAGIVTLGQDDIVINFVEKPQQASDRLANAAIYILSAEMLEVLVKRYSWVKDISTEVIPEFLGRIHAHACDGMLVDIGSVERYERLNNMLEFDPLKTVEK